MRSCLDISQIYRTLDHNVRLVCRFVAFVDGNPILLNDKSKYTTHELWRMDFRPDGESVNWTCVGQVTNLVSLAAVRDAAANETVYWLSDDVHPNGQVEQKIRFMNSSGESLDKRAAEQKKARFSLGKNLPHASGLPKNVKLTKIAIDPGLAWECTFQLEHTTGDLDQLVCAQEDINASGAAIERDLSAEATKCFQQHGASTPRATNLRVQVKVRSHLTENDRRLCLKAIFTMSGFDLEQKLADLLRSGDGSGKDFARHTASSIGKFKLPAGVSLKRDFDSIASTIRVLNDRLYGTPGSVLYAISDQNRIFTRARTPEFNTGSTSVKVSWSNWKELSVPEISGSVVGFAVQCGLIYLAANEEDQRCSMRRLNLQIPNAQWVILSGEVTDCKDICRSPDRSYWLKADGSLSYRQEELGELSEASWTQLDLMGKEEKERCKRVLQALLHRDVFNEGTHACYADEIAPSGCFTSSLDMMQDQLEQSKRITIVTFRELVLHYFTEEMKVRAHSFKATRFFGKFQRLMQEWVTQGRTTFNIVDANAKNWSRGSAQTKAFALVDIDCKAQSLEDKFEQKFHDVLLTGEQISEKQKKGEKKKKGRNKKLKGSGFPNWPGHVPGLKHARQYWKKRVAKYPVDFFGLFRLVNKECKPSGRQSIDKGPSSAWNKIYNQVYPSLKDEFTQNGREEVQRQVYVAYFDVCEDVLKEAATNSDEAWQLSLENLYDEADEPTELLDKDPIKFLQSAQGHAEKLEQRFKMLRSRPKITEDDESVYEATEHKMKEIGEDLCKAKQELEDLKGRTTTILGAQGVGKSTFVNNLLRMGQNPNVQYGRAKDAGAEAAECFAASQTGHAPEMKMLSEKDLNDSVTQREHKEIIKSEKGSDEPFVRYCVTGQQEGAVFKPFLLHAADTASATTERAVSIRYGDTYHILVEYYSTDEIEAEVAKDPEDKTIQAWKSRLSAETTHASKGRGIDESDSDSDEDGDSESDNESDDGCSEDADADADADDADADGDGDDDDDDDANQTASVGTESVALSKEVKTVAGKAFIYCGYGKRVHINVDRILCRDKIKHLLHDDPAHAAIKKLTVFAPSQLLEGGHQWIDAPGSSDEDALHRAQLTNSLSVASHVLIMLKDKDLYRQESDTMSIVRTTLFERVLQGSVSLTMVLSGENQLPLSAWIVGAKEPHEGMIQMKVDQFKRWEEKHNQLNDCLRLIQPKYEGTNRNERESTLKAGQLYQELFEYVEKRYSLDERKTLVGLSEDSTESVCNKKVIKKIHATVAAVKVLRPRFFLYASLMDNIGLTFARGESSLWTADREVWSTARKRSDGGAVITELSNSLYSGPIQHLKAVQSTIRELFEDPMESQVEMVKRMAEEAPNVKARASLLLKDRRKRSSTDAEAFEDVNEACHTKLMESAEYKAVESLMLLFDDVTDSTAVTGGGSDSDDESKMRHVFMKDRIHDAVMMEANKIANKLRQAKSDEIREALKASRKGGVTSVTISADDSRNDMRSKDKVATITLQAVFMQSLQNQMGELTKDLHKCVTELRDLCRDVVRQQLEKVLHIDQTEDDLERVKERDLLRPILDAYIGKLWPISQEESRRDHAGQTLQLTLFMGGEATTWMMGDALRADGSAVMRKQVRERIAEEVKSSFETGVGKRRGKGFRGVHVRGKRSSEMVEEFLEKAGQFAETAWSRCVRGTRDTCIAKRLQKAWSGESKKNLVPPRKKIGAKPSILMHAYKGFLELIGKDRMPTEAERRKQEAMQKLQEHLYSSETSTNKLCRTLIGQYASLQKQGQNELEKLLIRRRLMDSMEVAPRLQRVPAARDELKTLLSPALLEAGADTDKDSPFHKFVNNPNAPIDCAPRSLPMLVGTWGADHYLDLTAGQSTVRSNAQLQASRTGLRSLWLALLHATDHWKAQSTDVDLPTPAAQMKAANRLALRTTVNLDSSILASNDKKKFKKLYCGPGVGPDQDYTACINALLMGNAADDEDAHETHGSNAVSRAAPLIQQFCNLYLCNVDVYVPTTDTRTCTLFHIKCRVRTENIRYPTRAYRLAFFKNDIGEPTFSSVMVDDWFDVPLRDVGIKLRYNKTKLLGKGKVGEVFKGQYTQTRRSPDPEECAVKVVHSSDTHGSVAQTEADILRDLYNRSNFVIKLFEQYEDLDAQFPVTYLAMEFCELSMAKWLDLNPTGQERLVACRQLCEGLRSLHHEPFGDDRVFIHRDLKPDNIMFKRTNGRFQPKILDLSAARIVHDGQRNRTHDVGGSLGFLAPEQVTAVEGSRETQAIDIHTLGNVFYGIFNYSSGPDGVKIHNLFDESGRDPFRTIETHILEGQRTPVFDGMIDRLTSTALDQKLEPYLAQELEDLIHRMTEKDPAKRLPIKRVLQHPLFQWPGPTVNGWSAEGPRMRVEWIRTQRVDLGTAAWLNATNDACKPRLEMFRNLPRKSTGYQDDRGGLRSLSAHGLLDCIRNTLEHPDIHAHSILGLKPGIEYTDAHKGDSVGRFFLDQFPELFVSLFEDILGRPGASEGPGSDIWNLSQASPTTDGGRAGGSGPDEHKRKHPSTTNEGGRAAKGPRHEKKRSRGGSSSERQRKKR
eukprot:COSAG06_NODE_615_length_13769_cov_46.333138_2_plen_2583_part_00